MNAKSDFDFLVGQNVKKRRLELGLSQAELAEQLGYSAAAGVHKVEKGIVRVPKNKLPLFAAALHCRVADLTGASATAGPESGLLFDVSQAPGISSEGRDIAATFQQLNPEHQQIVLATLMACLAAEAAAPESQPVKLPSAPTTAMAIYPWDRVPNIGPLLPPALYWSDVDPEIVPSEATFAVSCPAIAVDPGQKAELLTVFVRGGQKLIPGAIGLFAVNGQPFIRALEIFNEQAVLIDVHQLAPEMEIQPSDTVKVLGEVLRWWNPASGEWGDYP